MSTPLFRQIAVIGLGLIGGSFALDVRRLHQAERIIGYDQRSHHCEEALYRHLVEHASTEFDAQLGQADLVLLATPVRAFPQVLTQLIPHLATDALVTDVGSVKAPLLRTVEQFSELRGRFLGGHPIAGSEQFGPSSARTHLFEGKRFILTPEDSTPLAVRQRLRALWESIGSDVCEMSATRHDQIFAAVSHLPHLIAYASIHAIIGSDAAEVLQFSGAGLKDFSRIASSSPEMWADILLDNREQLLPRLQHLQQVLRDLEHTLQQEERAALLALLQEAKIARDQWIG